MRALKRSKSGKPEELDQFEQARSFFEANRGRLLTQYKGKYVAILDGEVVDADEDFSLLAERVFRREGVRDIFMPRVQEGPEVVNIPSPQFRRQ
ncbi:MAG: hypothetical protein HY671_06885 [Chloroflexi bacterium]|nr:hypothetical protein [Chloroflexota bacterium]